MEAPALVVIGIWFLWQYVSVFTDMEMGKLGGGGVAYWDHIGGFLSGVVIIWSTISYLKWKQANAPPQPEDEPTVSAPAGAASTTVAPAQQTSKPDPFARALASKPTGAAAPELPQSAADPFAGGLPTPREPVEQRR